MAAWPFKQQCVSALCAIRGLLAIKSLWYLVALLSLSLPGRDAVCRDVDVAHAASPLFMAFVWVHDPFVCCSMLEPEARTVCVHLSETSRKKH